MIQIIEIGTGGWHETISWNFSPAPFSSLEKRDFLDNKSSEIYKIKILDGVRPYFIPDKSGRRQIMGQYTRLSIVNHEVLLEKCDFSDDEKIILLTLLVPAFEIPEGMSVPEISPLTRAVMKKEMLGEGVVVYYSRGVEIVYMDTTFKKDGFQNIVAIFKIKEREIDSTPKVVGPRQWLVDPHIELIKDVDKKKYGKDGPKAHLFITWNSISEWKVFSLMEDAEVRSYYKKPQKSILGVNPRISRYFGEDESEEISRLEAESRRAGMNQRNYLFFDPVS